MERPCFAFTSVNPEHCRAIITKASVRTPQILPDDKITFTTKALWDTGASRSVITPEIVSQLGLKPIGKGNSVHAGGESEVNIYLVDILLPNNVTVQNVMVSECAEQKGMFGLIVGMDIISMGDFSISGPAQRRTMSFTLPTNLTVDFVKIFNNMANNKT